MAKKKRRSKPQQNFDIRFKDLDQLAMFYHETTGKYIPEDMISHERAHYDKACQLGYTAEYRLRFGRDLFTTITLEPEGEVSDKDLIVIAEAPENPSFQDRATARNARERLGML